MLIEALLNTARKRLMLINDGAPLIEAAKVLSRGEKTSLVVVCDSDGKMAGVITKADVVREISSCQGCSCTVPVTATMTREVTACRPDDRLQDVWLIMKNQDLKQIPVIDHDLVPIGLLYASDALQVLLNEVQIEDLQLRDYVMGVGYR